MPAPYFIFEGCDGTGKTTTMHAVADRLRQKMPQFDPVLTHHPGSTPLGRYLRQLVKYPTKTDPEMTIDDLSRQVLYMVDTISYVRTVLEPNLAAGRAVMADRSSFISAIVYGLADGLDMRDVTRILELITPPKADRLYILQCPTDLGRERIKSTRGELDHYDQKSLEFAEKVSKIYAGLITTSAQQTVLVSRSVSIDNVMYVDASRPLDQVVDFIVADATSVIEDRYS